MNQSLCFSSVSVDEESNGYYTVSENARNRQLFSPENTVSDSCAVTEAPEGESKIMQLLGEWKSGV